MNLEMGNAPVAVVRGGGDIATGVVQKLWHAGFQVAILEIARPLVIRTTVALCTAVTNGVARVEDMTARRVASPAACQEVWQDGEIPILVDPTCSFLPGLQPSLLVDAIIAKKNLGTHRGMAPVMIALGPGFSAPEDVDAVIETMRGHDLGRVILEGRALPNTGIPGEIGGKSAERVVHAPAAGIVRQNRRIGDRVEKGETICRIGDVSVPSPLTGTLRGLISEGMMVPKGLKCADVDPRSEDEVDCLSVSDKARALGGAVLEAAMYLHRRKKRHPHYEHLKIAG
ncbi:EF2563 family selenium-dependent molybdenum hydroxylase system protein [Synergistaceae bacterium OttesenSCG-928-I11]|nr:EF2563 family selenium-dependent molybdenum hydroxylase system protein [Synergistaceae bacterium OttesenSCG-928-I11]